MYSAAERIAALYDWRCSRGGSTKNYQPIAGADLSLLSRYVDIPTSRICDAGCGNGAHLRAAVGMGASYPVGVDVSAANLAALIGSSLAKSTIVVHADYTTWSVGPLFDAVICSLPTICRREAYGLRDVLITLRSMTCQGGKVFLKLFEQSRLESVQGKFSILYDGATSEKVSQVSASPEGESITIRQYFADAPDDVWHETVDTPTQDEVIDEAQTAGFGITRLDHSRSLRGTQSYLLSN